MVRPPRALGGLCIVVCRCTLVASLRSLPPSLPLCPSAVPCSSLAPLFPSCCHAARIDPREKRACCIRMSLLDHFVTATNDTRRRRAITMDGRHSTRPSSQTRLSDRGHVRRHATAATHTPRSNRHTIEQAAVTARLELRRMIRQQPRTFHRARANSDPQPLCLTVDNPAAQPCIRRHRCQRMSSRRLVAVAADDALTFLAAATRPCGDHCASSESLKPAL